MCDVCVGCVWGVCGVRVVCGARACCAWRRTFDSIYDFKQKLEKQETSTIQKPELFNIKLDYQLPVYTPLKQQVTTNNYFFMLKPSLKLRDKRLSLSKNSNAGNERKEGRDMNSNNNQSFNIGVNTDKQYLPKKYVEVMDTFSLHHLVIRKGVLIEESPEFASYKRTYQLVFGKIKDIMSLLEQLAKKYEVDYMHVDGKRIAQLSEAVKKPSYEQLVSCIVNPEIQKDLLKYSNQEKDANYSPDQISAVILIQKNYRMSKHYKQYQKQKDILNRIKKIQKFTRLFLNKLAFKRKIQDKNSQLHQNFQKQLKLFLVEWGDLKYKKRVEIHINSFSFDVKSAFLSFALPASVNQFTTSCGMLARGGDTHAGVQAPDDDEAEPARERADHPNLWDQRPAS